MFKYKQITDVLGRCILDGRGFPAIEVEILSEDGEIGRAAVSLELPEEHMEELAESMILFINTSIADMLIGENILSQNHIDQILERMAGIDQKKNMRSQAARVVSCAAARTAANSFGIPLYQYLGGIQIQTCPTVRICLSKGKEEDTFCQSAINKWKKIYRKTNVIWEEQEHDSEKKIDTGSYTTISQYLREIRSWKKELRDPIVLKDNGYVLDDFIVDLAIASEVDVLELRPPVCGENTVKYSQLMRIQEHL